MGWGMQKGLIIAALLLIALGGAFALTVGPFTPGTWASARDDPVFYNELGYHLAQSDMAAAQAAFQRAVDLDPSYENARKNLYVAAFQNGEYAVSAAHARVLHDAHPDAQYAFDLAQALVMHARTQATDAALAELEEAASLLVALGQYPHAPENAGIVRSVLAENGAAD